MGRTLIYILLFLLSFKTVAQEITHYTNFTQNLFGINPSFAGMKECIDVRMGSRLQWAGFKGAPFTAFLNVNGRIKIKTKKYRTDFHGWGFDAELDRAGVFRKAYINAAYAYNFPISRKFRAAAGFRFGVINNVMSIANQQVSDFQDPLLDRSQSKWLFPNVSAGFTLYSDVMFVSLGLRQLVPLDVKVGPEAKLRPHVSLMGSYRIKNLTKWAFTPSAQLQWANSSPVDINIQLSAEYNRNFTIGLGYRNIDAVYAFFKVHFLNQFTIAYSFDFVTSNIRQGTNLHTHEITVGIYTCKLRKKTDVRYCPSVY